jgi:F-type H+-transporting ATPase subunit b
MEMLENVRQLLLRALPTFFVVVILYFYLRSMLFKPLEETLEKRKAATSGTRGLASESFQRAEQKAAEYEEKLRAARGEIYKEQEQLRKKWRDEQAEAIAAAKQDTDGLIREARKRLAEREEADKANLETASHALADKIADTVLAGGAH